MEEQVGVLLGHLSLSAGDQLKLQSWGLFGRRVPETGFCWKTGLCTHSHSHASRRWSPHCWTVYPSHLGLGRTACFDFAGTSRSFLRHLMSRTYTVNRWRSSWSCVLLLVCGRCWPCIVVTVGWGRVGSLSGCLLATGAGPSSRIDVARGLSRLKGVVDRRNCILPDLWNQSCRGIALFVTDSSRNSFRIRSDDWQSCWSAIACVVH